MMELNVGLQQRRSLLMQSKLYWRVLLPSQAIITLTVLCLLALSVLALLGFIYNPVQTIFLMVINSAQNTQHQGISELDIFTQMLYVLFCFLSIYISVSVGHSLGGGLSDLYINAVTSSKENKVIAKFFDKKRKEYEALSVKMNKKNALEIAKKEHWEKWKRANNSSISYDDWKKSYLRDGVL